MQRRGVNFKVLITQEGFKKKKKIKFWTGGIFDSVPSGIDKSALDIISQDLIWSVIWVEEVLSSKLRLLCDSLKLQKVRVWFIIDMTIQVGKSAAPAALGIF